MSITCQFSGDVEFQKLITRQADVDLTITALEIARDADPSMDFGCVTRWLDQRASELSGRIAQAQTEQDALQQLAWVLAEEQGLGGDEGCFQTEDSSYLNRVIANRRGIPITLSLIYMDVAKRLGLELNGVSAPVHFLTRYEASDGPIFVDAFSNGRLMRHDDCCEWLSGMTQLSPEALSIRLNPAGPREIVTRLLNNLKLLYVHQDDWRRAARVQRRIVALHRQSYEELRDLAVVLSNAQQSHEAIDLLESCLEVCPDSDRQLLEQELVRSRNNNARWN